MSTLSSVLKNKSPGPYQKGVKVMVVAARDELKYKAKDGKEKSLISVAISDGVEVLKCVVFDSTKFSRFKVSNTLILRDIIKKEDGSIVVTSATKVYITPPLTVPEEHYTAGQRILNPDPAEQIDIKDALNSPPRKKVSIKGKIVQEEEPKVVKVRDEQVTIKTITVTDHTGSSKVTLWRESSQALVRPGDHVLITDVVVNHYNNNTSLQTTNPSIVKKLECPEETREISVEAISVSEGTADLLTTNGENVLVPAEMLQQIIDFENEISEGSFSLRITTKGNDVISIDKM